MLILLCWFVPLGGKIEATTQQFACARQILVHVANAQGPPVASICRSAGLDVRYVDDTLLVINSPGILALGTLSRLQKHPAIETIRPLLDFEFNENLKLRPAPNRTWIKTLALTFGGLL